MATADSLNFFDSEIVLLHYKLDLIMLFDNVGIKRQCFLLLGFLGSQFIVRYERVGSVFVGFGNGI